MKNNNLGLSFVQWNVWDHSDPNKVAERMVDIGADVYCLQEVATESTLQPGKKLAEILMKDMGYYGVFEQACRFDLRFAKGSIGQGLGIFSKHPLTLVQSTELSRGGWHYELKGRPLDRKYLEASVQLPGVEPISVGTTHLSLLDSEIASPGIRKREADILESIVKQKNKRFILSGDFNSNKRGPAAKAISRKLSRVDGRLDSNTWTGSIRILGREVTVGKRIDYVFHSDDLEVVCEEVLSRNPSDHHPLKVDFRV
jgi:endonuclease/exonuclease/phosphatase family metal-dependent hydrolase